MRASFLRCFPHKYPDSDLILEEDMVVLLRTYSRLNSIGFYMHLKNSIKQSYFFILPRISQVNRDKEREF